MRMSLWAKNVIGSFATIGIVILLAIIFLLNAVGDGLFVFRYLQGGDAAVAETSVQLSAGLLLILGLAYLIAVFLVWVSAERHGIPDTTVKMAVFFVGAGLFTLASHMVRLSATFLIWKPTNAAAVDPILSRSAYYASGMTLEVFTVILYTATRIDLLFRSATTAMASRPTSSQLDTQTRSLKVPPRALRSPDSLRMHAFHDADGLRNPPPQYPRNGDRGSLSMVKDQPKERDSTVSAMSSIGSQEDMFGIQVQRTFSVSTQRVSFLSERTESMCAPSSTAYVE